MRSYLLVFTAENARLVPLEDGWLRRSADGLVVSAEPTGAVARLGLSDGEAWIAAVAGEAPSASEARCLPNERPSAGEAPSASEARCLPNEGPSAGDAPSASEARCLLNDVPLAGEVRLTSGDVLAVGDLRAVFHRDPRQRPPARVLGPDDLAERSAQEVERARRYRRPLALLVVSLAPEPRGSRRSALGLTPGATERDVASAALRAVRRSDVVGFTQPTELVVLFPEVSETAMVPARRVVSALRALLPEVRGGLSLLPADGDEPDALLTGARRAAARAAPGEVARLADATGHLQLGDSALITVDPKMHALLTLVRDLARSDLPVLVSGETGAGKDLVARALHAASPRARRPFVAFNCAAVAESLIESELFGHRQGAFSGASADRVGLLESAAGGTVFLDEVGECSPRVQAELLRVLEGGVVRPVGATSERKVDLRFVAATNRDLDAESRGGRFRRDLYFRLGAARLVVPPLRERPLDVPVLARHFLDDACAALDRPPPALSDDALLRLCAHDWPGNVRELRNLMRLLAAVARGDTVEADDLPEGVAGRSAPWRGRRDLTPPPEAGPGFRPLSEEVRDLERRRMAQALALSGGVRVRAAALIGMPLRTFATKLKALRLDGPGAAP